MKSAREFNQARAMESAKQFSARAQDLLHRAIYLSEQRCGDKTVLNQWMAQAKRQRMTWVEGLVYSIQQMQGPMD
jgi:hypothetical protein